jgi:FlaA1/EpsC-like NDP-sugar epimerase
MLQQPLKSVVGLSRLQKGMLNASVDLIFLILAIWASFSLRLEAFYVPPFHLYWIFLLAPLLAIPIFVRFGLYHAIIRYIGFQALWAGER